MSNNPLLLHPVDWLNHYGEFSAIFSGVRDHHFITPNEVALQHPTEPHPNEMNKPTFILTPHGNITVHKPNLYRIPVGATVSKFTLLSLIRFKGSHSEAITFITHDLIGDTIPYIRVGGDYFKVITKTDRYGADRTYIKPWRKDEIKQDHGPAYIQSIQKYDDFTIVPDNKEYHPVINNCYNLYSKFAHVPATGQVNESHIPATMTMLRHIFGEHLPIALRIYLKCLYEHPKQALHTLCLVSKERDTGKTTFINWIEMLFGNNSVLIPPEDIVKNFNVSYATKNIVMMDETMIEKQTGVEKIKSLNTAKSITVHQKFVSEYSVPCFMKIIMCTNKIHDFMRIDEEEVRFWVRHVKPIEGKKNTNIEAQLFSEIPAFLRFISDLPPVDFNTGSRFVLTNDQIETDALREVKTESRGWLFKELEILITDFFDENANMNEFHATATDIKHKWFVGNNQVSIAYITKVLRQEAGMEQQRGPNGGPIKYRRFNDDALWPMKAGIPFLFRRSVNDQNPPFTGDIPLTDSSLPL